MAVQQQAAEPQNDGLVARLAAKREKWKAAASKLTSERDEALKRAEAAEKERDEAVSKAAKIEQGGSAKRVAELEQQIRVRNHRDKFTELAKARGADDAAVDALWQLAGWEVKGDDIDETEMAALLDQQKAHPAQSRLFGQTQANGKTEPVIKPGVGAGRGATTPPAVAPYSVAEGDPHDNDVVWMFSNFDKRAQMAADRIARGEV